MFLNTNDTVWKCCAIFFHFKTVTFFLNLMMTIKIIYLSRIYRKECNIDLLFIVTKYIVPSSGPILNYMYSKKKIHNDIYKI